MFWWKRKSENKQSQPSIEVPVDLEVVMQSTPTHPLATLVWILTFDQRIGTRVKVFSRYGQQESMSPPFLLRQPDLHDLRMLVGAIDEADFFSLAPEYKIGVCDAGIGRLGIRANGQTNLVEVWGFDDELMQQQVETARFLKLWNIARKCFTQEFKSLPLFKLR